MSAGMKSWPVFAKCHGSMCSKPELLGFAFAFASGSGMCKDVAVGSTPLESESISSM